jgi:hypothetical protein
MVKFCRPLLGILLAMTTVACGGDSSTEPERLEPADVNGTWVIALTTLPNCAPISLSQVRVAVNFRADGQTGNVGSSWDRGANTPTLAATGQINFETGRVDLHLWGDINESAIAVSGTVTAQGTFTGSARDPAPSYDSVWSFGICEYNAAGSRQ